MPPLQAAFGEMLEELKALEGSSGAEAAAAAGIQRHAVQLQALQDELAATKQRHVRRPPKILEP